MTPDRTPDDDDDQAWLLARERGEPGPAISDARAGRYAQLGTLIADLPAVPAGTAQRPDWEQGVLAAIDAEVGQPVDPSGTPPVVTDKPLPQRQASMRRPRRGTATAAAAVFVMLASVAIVVFLRERRDSRIDVESGSQGRSGVASSPEVTRGMHVERGRLGVDHVLQVRRSNAPAFRELHDGDTVTTGDRIRASVTTSTDAYFYLAFCSDQHLQMYPSQRGIRTRAGDAVLVPEGDGELVLDNHPGSEVVYLIVSQNELSVADPRLAALLVASGDGTKPVACGESLDLELMASGAPPPSNVLRGETIAADGAGSPGAVVGADAHGIAIVRYRFTHVSPERVDDH